MKVEIQSDSSTANSLTDRFRAGPRTKHTDTPTSGYKNEFKMEISASRRCLQSKNCADVRRSHFLLPYYNDTASVQDWCSTDNGSQTPLQDDGTSTSTETRQLSTLVVNTETCAKHV